MQQIPDILIEACHIQVIEVIFIWEFSFASQSNNSYPDTE